MAVERSVLPKFRTFKNKWFKVINIYFIYTTSNAMSIWTLYSWNVKKSKNTLEDHQSDVRCWKHSRVFCSYKISMQWFMYNCKKYKVYAST